MSWVSEFQRRTQAIAKASQLNFLRWIGRTKRQSQPVFNRLEAYYLHLSYTRRSQAMRKVCEPSGDVGVTDIQRRVQRQVAWVRVSQPDLVGDSFVQRHVPAALWEEGKGRRQFMRLQTREQTLERAMERCPSGQVGDDGIASIRQRLARRRELVSNPARILVVREARLGYGFDMVEASWIVAVRLVA